MQTEIVSSDNARSFLGQEATALIGQIVPFPQALHDLHRGGKTGPRIERILPHLEGFTGTNSRSGSPELVSKPRQSQDLVTSNSAEAKTPPAVEQSSPPPPNPRTNTTGKAARGTDEKDSDACGALKSIANPDLIANPEMLQSSYGNKGSSGSVKSFRGRGGAFSMLLHKVQTGHPGVTSTSGTAAPLAGGVDSPSARPEAHGGTEEGENSSSLQV